METWEELQRLGGWTEPAPPSAIKPEDSGTPRSKSHGVTRSASRNSHNFSSRPTRRVNSMAVAERVVSRGRVTPVALQQRAKAELEAQELEAQLHGAASPNFDSQAQRSPRVQSMRRKGGAALGDVKKERDISYRRDRPGHGISVKSGQFLSHRVPETIIPKHHHIVVKSPIQPEDNDYHSEFRLDDRQWHTTIFPAMRPSKREDVKLLAEWVDKVLSEELPQEFVVDADDEDAREDELVRMVERAQYVYSMAFHELVRQVYCHTIERGKLMKRVWKRYFEHSHKVLSLLRDEKERAIRRLNASHIQEIQNVHEEADATVKDAKAYHKNKMKEVLADKAKLHMRLQVTQRKLQNRQEKIAKLLNEKLFYESKISYILRNRDSMSDAGSPRPINTLVSPRTPVGSSPRSPGGKAAYGAEVDVVNGYVVQSGTLGPLDSSKEGKEVPQISQKSIEAAFQALEDKLKEKEEGDEKGDGDSSEDEEAMMREAEAAQLGDGESEGEDGDSDGEGANGDDMVPLPADFDPNHTEEDDLGDYEPPPPLLDVHLRMDRLKDRLAISHKYTKVSHITSINSALMDVEGLVRQLQLAELNDDQESLEASQVTLKDSQQQLIDKTPVASRLPSWNDMSSGSDTDSDQPPVVDVENLMAHFWDDAEDDLDEDGNPIQKKKDGEGNDLQASNAPHRPGMPTFALGPNMHVTDALRSKWKSVIDGLKAQAEAEGGESKESDESLRQRTEALNSLSAALETRVEPKPRVRDESIGPIPFAESDIRETYATTDAATVTDYYWAVDFPDDLIEYPEHFPYPLEAADRQTRLADVARRVVQRMRVKAAFEMRARPRSKTKQFNDDGSVSSSLKRASSIASTTDVTALLANIDKALFESRKAATGEAQSEAGASPRGDAEQRTLGEMGKSRSSPNVVRRPGQQRGRAESTPMQLGRARSSGRGLGRATEPMPMSPGSQTPRQRSKLGIVSSDTDEDDSGDDEGVFDESAWDEGAEGAMEGGDPGNIDVNAEESSASAELQGALQSPRTSTPRGRTNSRGPRPDMRVVVGDTPTISIVTRSPVPGQTAPSLGNAEHTGTLVRLEAGHVSVSSELLNQLRDTVVDKDYENQELRSEMTEMEDELERLRKILGKVQTGAEMDSDDETPRERSRAALSRHLGFKKSDRSLHIPRPSKRKSSRLAMSIIPPAFRKMFAKKPPRSTVQRSIRWTLKYISSILTEKIAVDVIDDRAGVPRQGLAEFVHDNHLNKYGLKKLAAKHIMDLLTAINTHRNTHARVGTFARFAGMGKEPLPLWALDFYLHALACMRTSVEASSWKGQVFIRSVDAEEETCHVTVAQALDAFKHIFPLSRSDELSVYCNKVFAANVGTAYRNTSKLDVDKLLDQLLEDFMIMRERFAVPLSSVFKAADLDDDHVLDIPEFRRVMRYLCPNKSKKDVVKMYRLVLLDNPVLMGVDGLTQAMFERVLRDCGIQFWNVMPDKYFVGEIDMNLESLDYIWEVTESTLIKLANKTDESSSRFETLKGLIIALQRDMDKKEEPLVAWTRYKLLYTELYRSNTAKQNYSGNYNPLSKKKKRGDSLRRDLARSSKDKPTSLRTAAAASRAVGAFSRGTTSSKPGSSNAPYLRERSGGAGLKSSSIDRRPSTLGLLLKRAPKEGSTTLEPPRHMRRRGRARGSRTTSPTSDRSNDRSYERSVSSTSLNQSDADESGSKKAISRTPSSILLSLGQDS